MNKLLILLFISSSVFGQNMKFYGLNHRPQPGTSPIYIAASAIVYDVSGAASTTPTPPAHIADDILIIMASNESGSTMSTVTAGWTQIAQYDGDMNVAWFWKRAAGSGTAGATITAADTDQYAICYIIRHCYTGGAPYEDETAIGDRTDEILTSEVTTISGNRLVASFAAIANTEEWDHSPPPINWTLNNDAFEGTGDFVTFTVISRNQAAIATIAQAIIGTQTYNEYWGSLTLAFKPE